MLHAQGQSLLDTLSKPAVAKTRHTKNKVDGYIVVTSPAKSLNRLHSLRSTMSAIHKLKHPVLEGLYAETYAIDRGIMQLLHILLSEVVGIGLDGNLLNSRAVEEVTGVLN